MKKIFKYFGLLLSVALIGAATACNPTEIEESADLGLGIKVFFPTKVVAGQPMTVNGSGFSAVKEIVFPDGVTVSSFELVSDEMIRVTAPSGISAAGGKLIVRTADEEAESAQTLTLGNTVINGFSKQDGESINGGEQLTIYGKDLEFISQIELLDTDGNPLILQDEDFYRKGTSTVIITFPKKGVFEDGFSGTMRTFDGRTFPLPELSFVPASDGGHWEMQEIVVWEGSMTSSGYSNVDNMGTEDDWANAGIAEGDLMRIYFTTTDPDNWVIQLFGLHWGAFNHSADGTNKFTKETDPDAIKNGYIEIPVTADIVTELTTKAYWGAAMIWQGDPEVTVTKMTLAREVWVDGGGDDQPVEVEEVLFEGESVFDSWSATMVIDAGLFADVVEGAVLTVTFKDKGDDYNPIFKHVSDWSDWAELQGVKVDTDNSFSAVIPAEAVEELKSSGLRFQGLGFTIVKVTLKTWKTVGPVTEKVLFDGDPVVYDSWSATQIVTGFNDVAEGFTIRVTIKDKGDDYNPIFKHVSDWSDWSELQGGKVDTDTGFETVVPAEAVDELKASGLRFQGLGFTIVKVELIPA